MISKKTSMLALLLTFLACIGPAHAELQKYSSIFYDKELPYTAFLLGEIKPSDSFELRRIIRDHEIELIVVGSPGGNLYEGLQMASIIHDNKISTYLPSGWSCESSCASVFLGGESRIAIGELGVHQFYMPNADNRQSSLSTATESALYTTSDIIGILNEFETPSFVYERMFGTTEIYYFNEVEKRRLSKNTTGGDFFNRVGMVDRYATVHEFELSGLRRGDQQPFSPNPKVQSQPAPGNPTTITKDDSIFSDTDFYGSDLGQSGHRNVSVEQCDQICRSNPNCAAWSYVNESRWCWPKASVINISSAIGVVSSVVDYSRVDQSIFERQFQETTAEDIRGFDIFPQGLASTSLPRCRSICKRNSNCAGFSWVANQNLCFLKYNVGETVRAIGVISGILLKR